MADPLLEMAIRAGIIPPSQGQGGIVDPFSESMPEEQPVTSPFTTPVADPPVAMEPEPAFDVTANRTGTVGTKQGQSVSVSQGGRGYNPNAQRLLDKRDRPLAAANAQIDQESASEVDAQSELLVDAGAQSKIAAGDVAASIVGKVDAQGRQAKFMSDLQQEFSKKEAQANVDAEGESAMARTEYVKALADFRASKVDSNQLWNSQSSGMQFGMLAAVFAHDFLGAKGIKTSAMDTLNTAINRNIDAQVTNIKNKGEVAEGFKSLWYMQRSQSRSDAESRERVRGFLLEGAKQAVIANMAQYDSALASAQGQAGVAEIDKELANNLVKVMDHARTNAQARKGQALQWETSKMNAAIASWQASIHNKSVNETIRKNKAAEDAAKVKTQDLSSIMPDTSVSGGGKARWKFYAGTDAKQDDIRDKMGALNSFADTAREMQELARKIGPVPQIAWKRAMSQDQRRLLQLRDRLGYSMAYAESGKQLTIGEIKQKIDQLPIETWMTRGGTAEQIATTVRAQHVDFFSKMAPFVRELKEGVDPEFGMVLSPSLSPDGDLSNLPGGGEANEAAAAARGDIDKRDREQVMMDQDLEKIRGPSSAGMNKYRNVGEDIRAQNEAFKKAEPEMALKLAGDNKTYYRDYASNVAVGLGQMARTTEQVDKHGQPTETAKEALAYLERQALSYQKNAFPGDGDDIVGAYANMLLFELKKNK